MVAAQIDLTQSLLQAQAGDSAAADRAFRQLYPDLQRIARARLRGHAAPTLLDTQALVHESFLRFATGARVDFASRKHFFAWVSKAMRHLVVDFARRQAAVRHGGALQRVTLHTELDEADGLNAGTGIEELDAALQRLAVLDPQLADLVELRFFGGYTEPEAAVAMGMSERSLRRLWQKARACLLLELQA